MLLPSCRSRSTTETTALHGPLNPSDLTTSLRDDGKGELSRWRRPGHRTPVSTRLSLHHEVIRATMCLEHFSGRKKLSFRASMLLHDNRLRKLAGASTLLQYSRVYGKVLLLFADHVA